MIVLGIETSCDETAAAVVKDDRTILSNIVASQTALHAEYGGVVPEIASRAHLALLSQTVNKAVQDAGVSFREIDAVAATSGPGLIGGVVVGLTFAKGIAAAANKPLIAVNHLEGHALTPRLTHAIDFPYLLLLVSGGHCQILVVEGVGKFKRLGGTIDDALGEAFDKTAKMLGLGYPGGPAIEKLAKTGDPMRFDFPKPLCGKPHCDFSFSGLKTAVLRTIQSIDKLSDTDISDIAASFQRTASDIMEDRLNQAFLACLDMTGKKNVVIAGGVAANQYLRDRLTEHAEKAGFTLIAPPIKLCTDNAAMIAWAGLERLKLGLTDPLSSIPRARWPLTELVT